MLTDEQQAAHSRFIRLGTLWQRGRPRSVPTPIPAPSADPYADLDASYGAETERETLDLGTPVEHLPKQVQRANDDVDDQDDLPGVGKWYGFHVDGDHRYE